VTGLTEDDDDAVDSGRSRRKEGRVNTNFILATTAVALWSSSGAAFMLHERLQGGMVSSMPGSAHDSGRIHLRLDVALTSPVTVSGRFRCRTVGFAFGKIGIGPCFSGRSGTVTNVVLTRRANPRDFFVYDFDADLVFVDVPVSCHIATAAPSVDNTFPSVTGGYTCVNAAGAVIDVGTFTAGRHCK
jgi:hypothetical protein